MRHLLAVLANPPVHESTITKQRVTRAAEVLNFDSFGIANLFSVPTRSVLDISTAGVFAEPWLLSRDELTLGIGEADAVLLAFGCQAPTGPARLHHREQVNWLYQRLAVLDLPVWMLGHRPHHPSRWQRYTRREYPSLSFADALPLAFREKNSNELVAPIPNWPLKSSSANLSES